MDKYSGYIYCITNQVTGKQYVGQTVTGVQKRFNDHIRCGKDESECSSLLYRAMKKYGVENFTIETIEILHSDSRESLKELLNEREIHHIALLNTYKPNGYNLTHGGLAFADHVLHPVYKVDKSGFVVAIYSSESEAEVCNGFVAGTVKRGLYSNSHYANGFYWYSAKKNHFSLGENIGEQIRLHTTPVFQFSLDGMPVARYGSIIDAERITGIHYSCISGVCAGKRLSSGGYLWSYTNVAPMYSPSKDTRSIPVLQMKMDGTPIKEYVSATEAAKCLGLHQTLISKCCLGKRKSTGGFRWAYFNAQN